MANMGLFDSIRFKTTDMATIPAITPAMMRQEAIRDATRMTPASRIARVDVSPREPAMLPRKAASQSTA